MAGVGFASAASASLTAELGGQVVYDSVHNLTWLADANLAATNTFGVSGINANGSMNWDTAQSWVAAMNTVNYLGYSDWSLPTSPGDTCIKNCTGSQLGGLFYGDLTSGLGGVLGSNIATTHNANYGLFSNIQSTPTGGYVGYWSGTEVPVDIVGNTDWAYFLFTTDGRQGWTPKGFQALYGWAVRTGDVTAVPLPAAVWLFGSALTGLTLLGAKRWRG